MVAQRCQYFTCRWNQFDILVVTSGWIGELFSGVVNLAFLRVVRVSRLTRAFRFLLQFRELYLLMNGVLGSLRAMFFGTGLLFAVIMAYSVILVEWAHPINSTITYMGCDECTFGFKSVWWSMLTLFKQLIAGDAWFMSFGLFEEGPLFAPLMIFVVVTISLGIMNIILAGVVDSAAHAREKDMQDKAQMKASDQLETKKELYKLCSEMDTNGSGSLSKEELFDAYENLPEFGDIMLRLDVQAEDLDALFRVLDQDGSGDLDYEEFCDELVALKSEDQQTLLILTRFAVQQIQHEIDHNMSAKIQNLVGASAKQEEQLQSINDKLDALCASRLPQATNPPKDIDQNDLVTSEIQASSKNSLNVPVAADLFDLMQQEIKCLATLNERVLQEVQLQMAMLNDQQMGLTSTKKQLFSVSGASEPIHGDDIHIVQPPRSLNKSKLTMTLLPQNMSTQVSLLSTCVQQNVSGASTLLGANRALLSRVKQLVFDLPAACTQTCPSSLASLSVVSTV